MISESPSKPWIGIILCFSISPSVMSHSESKSSIQCLTSLLTGSVYFPYVLVMKCEGKNNGFREDQNSGFLICGLVCKE